MPTPPETQSDAAFWAALSHEIQDQLSGEDAALEFFGMDARDTVFHASPPIPDPVEEPEPMPTLGEVFTR